MPNGNDNTMPGYTVPEGLDPWEQQPGEPSNQYEGFLCYLRQQRRNRSVRQAARIYYNKNYIEVTPQGFRGWASEWYWQQRALAYDRMMDRIQFEEAREARIEQAREHGYSVETVESLGHEASTQFGNKLVEAINNLDVNKPDYRTVVTAMKVFSEAIVNMYKLQKYKFDIQNEEYKGLSQEEMSKFIGATPRNQEQVEGEVPALVDDDQDEGFSEDPEGNYTP